MRRVGLVSAGVLSAFGAGVEPLVEGVFAGESRLRPPRRLAGDACPAGVLAELPWGLPCEPFSAARAAAQKALGAAPREGTALVLASTKADLSGVDAAAPAGAAPGLGAPWRLARALAAALGLSGPVGAVSTACSSGLDALALAGRWVVAGRAERVLVVGVDILTGFVVRGFDALLALDPDPCRPFDRSRRGLSLGEAAVALLLAADAPGPQLLGWGASNDANHVTGPCREGRGLTLAAKRALARADRAPGDVDLVHVHGTGTPYGDASEALGLARLFGDAGPPAWGTKAQTGHTLGAAGLLESLLAVEALRRGEVPGNAGLAEPDVAPGLRLARGSVRLARARCALKVSAGFGGLNAAVLWEVP